MISRIYDALLRRVYYPATAVVSLGADGHIVGVAVFDSLFGTEERVICSQAQTICVICSHPDGLAVLRDEDLCNIRRIAGEAGQRPLRVYIGGEDVGCFMADDPHLPGKTQEEPI